MKVNIPLNKKNKSNLHRIRWYDVYHCRKWTWQHEFKSWMRLIAFHIALIPLGKVWILLFSIQICVNSRENCNQSVRRKTLNSKPVKLCLRIDLVSHSAHYEGLEIPMPDTFSHFVGMPNENCFYFNELSSTANYSHLIAALLHISSYISVLLLAGSCWILTWSPFWQVNKTA